MNTLVIAGQGIIDHITIPNYHQGLPQRVAGGAATHAALAASMVCRQMAWVGSIGRDFPADTLQAVRTRGIALGSLYWPPHCDIWRAVYNPDFTVHHQSFISNAPQDTYPIPAALARFSFLYLSTANPSFQAGMLLQFPYAHVGLDTDRPKAQTHANFFRELMASQQIEFIMVNDVEAKLLTQTSDLSRCIQTFFSWGAKVVIIKLGAQGVLLAHWSAPTRFFSAPAPNRNPIDTTGAGDSFGGAFMGWLARSGVACELPLNLLLEALQVAAVIAAINVGGIGATALQETQLTLEDITARAGKVAISTET